MSMGKAIVATSSPGTRDYVEEDVTGAIVPTGDASAMRAAIARLWNDGDALQRMGTRNRAFAREYFAVEKHGQRVAALLGMVPARGPLTAAYDEHDALTAARTA
jgi:glycosyltransferase involved in cell wall biosynthesis